MKSIKTILQKLANPHLMTLVITGCFLSVSVTANAAMISYSGFADLNIELVSVTPNNGTGPGPGPGPSPGPGPHNFEVSSLASAFDLANASGSGSSDTFTSLLPSADWEVSNEFFQTSESFGEAGNAAGEASSYADTDFNILVTNNRSNSALTFEFLLSAFVSADVFVDGVAGALDDGGAFADIRLVDSLLGDLFYTSAEAFIGGLLVDSSFDEQTIEFTLEAGESRTLSGFISSDGYADVIAEVAEPSTIWLALISGMSLLTVSSKRRAKTALSQNNHSLS